MKVESIRIGAAVLVVVAGGGAFKTSAQESDWLQVDIVNVVPNQLDEYVELQLEEVNPALQQAGVPWRSVWRIAEFGNSYEIQLVTPMSGLSQYDTGGHLARVMEPSKRLDLVDRLRRMTVSRKRYAMRYRTDISVESDEMSGRTLARVTNVVVAPGRRDAWEEFLLKNVAAFSDAELVFGVYERVFGPGPSSWLIVENYSSFGQLEEPSLLVRAYGPDASTIASELSGVITSIERTVLRYDAELSYSTIPESTR